jgi:hypothetical protein
MSWLREKRRRKASRKTRLTLERLEGRTVPALFGAPTDLAFGPAWRIAAGDFNGDGTADLAVTLNGSGSTQIAASRLGDGVGGYGPIQTLNRPSPGAGLLAADVNGDGKDDLLVISGFCCGTSVHLGTPDGLTANATYGVPSAAADYGTADFNGDGRLDVVAAAGPQLLVSAGNGDGSFRFPSTGVAIPAAPISDALATDLNGDGRSDLVVVLPRLLASFLGNGDGTFLAGPTIGVAPDTVNAVLGDFNADGLPDVATHASSGKGILVRLGDGNGGFTVGPDLASDLSPSTLAAADFNGDGVDDLVTAEFGGTDLTVFLSDHEGGFGPALRFGVGGTQIRHLIAHDLNGDGRPDLAIVRGGTVTVLFAEATPSIDLTAVADPVPSGQDATFRATVAAPGAGLPVPTGTVTFREGATVLGTATLADGVASLSTPLAYGRHTVTATYEGDANYPGTVAVAAVFQQPEVITWVNPAGGAWSDPANWDLGRVPRHGDDVVIPDLPGAAVITHAAGTDFLHRLRSAETLELTGGTVQLVADSSLAGLKLAGGTFHVGAALELAGTFTWSRGTLTGAGVTTIAATGRVDIGGPDDKVLDRHLIGQFGAATLDGTGSLILRNAARWDVAPGGTFEVRGGRVPADFMGSTVVNGGRFLKTGGADVTFAPAGFHNWGEVVVEGGTLTLPAGTSPGTFRVATGAVLELAGGLNLPAAGVIESNGTVRFNGGTHTLAGRYDAAATVLQAGTVAFNQTGGVHFPTLTVAGGELRGTAGRTVTGTFSWTGGQLSGSGALHLPAGTQVEISGSDKSLAGTVHAAANVALSGMVRLDGATWNQWSGTFEIRGGGFANDWGAPSAFNNEATFVKSGPAWAGIRIPQNQFRFLWFNNRGTVRVQEGILELGNGGASTGVFEVAAEATLQLGATHMLGHSTLRGAGTVEMRFGSTVTLAGPYEVASTQVSGQVRFNQEAPVSLPTLSLASGTLGGDAELRVGEFTWAYGSVVAGNVARPVIVDRLTLNQSGSLEPALDGRPLTTTHTLLNGGAKLDLRRGAVFTAAAGGTVLLAGSSQITGEAGSAFVNEGNFTTACCGSSVVKALFHNRGTVTVERGYLSIAQGTSHDGAFVVGQIGTFNFGPGTYRLTGRSRLTGKFDLAANTFLEVADTPDLGGATFNVPVSFHVAPGDTLTLGGSFR